MAEETTPGQPVDLESFLDNVNFSSFHVKVVIIGMMAMLVDGFDLALLAWVLPLVSDDFGVDRTELTWVLSTQMAGMVLGAYFLAPVADIIGRKKLLIVGMLGVGVLCFFTIFTQTVWQLAILRFLTGIFASAVIANVVALVSEMAPTHKRSTMVTIVLSGSMPGAILGSMMQAFLLEPYGWHIAFYIGTAMPLILVPFMLFLLPESPKFLAARNPGDPRLTAIVDQLNPTDEPVTIAQPVVHQKRESSLRLVGNLFADGYAVPTILLWVSFFASFGFISAAYWKTTVFKDMVGLDWQGVGLTTGLGMGFGFLGMITIGMMIDKFGFKRIVPLYFIVGGLGAVIMALFTPGNGLFVGLAINAWAQHAAHAGLASIASTMYPTKNRATGVGWAYGAGRAASTIGPFYGALALKHDWGASGYFLLLAGPLALAGIVIFILLTVKPLGSGSKTGVAAH